MKKIYFLSLFQIFIGLIACKKSDSSKNAAYQPECSSATPDYQSEVSPLIISQCGNSSCHSAGSKNGPGALTTYAQVKAAASSVRSSIVSGSMPKNGSLTTAQKNSIVCWIDAGANP